MRRLTCKRKKAKNLVTGMEYKERAVERENTTMKETDKGEKENTIEENDTK